MKTTPLRRTPGVGGLALRSSVLLPLLLLPGAYLHAQETPAVLKLQEVDFTYRSSLVPLSCYELEHRVAVIFRALGAREDVEVRVSGCDTFVEPDGRMDAWEDRSDRWRTQSDVWAGPEDRWGGASASNRLNAPRSVRREQLAHVRAKVMMPVEVTPEVLAEIQRDKSRRELISRVTGDPRASLNDPIIFPAQRQNVTLSRRTIGLEPEDCELLDQLSRSAFRQLGIRVVRRGTHCGRDQISHIPPQLTVEALMPVMPQAPQLTPQAGEGDEEAEEQEEAASASEQQDEQSR